MNLRPHPSPGCVSRHHLETLPIPSQQFGRSQPNDGPLHAPNANFAQRSGAPPHIERHSQDPLPTNHAKRSLRPSGDRFPPNFRPIPPLPDHSGDPKHWRDAPTSVAAPGQPEMIVKADSRFLHPCSHPLGAFPSPLERIPKLHQLPLHLTLGDLDQNRFDQTEKTSSAFLIPSKRSCWTPCFCLRRLPPRPCPPQGKVQHGQPRFLQQRQQLR